MLISFIFIKKNNVLTLAILFSTAVKVVVVVVVPKVVILGISPLSSFILASKEELVAT